LPDRHNKKRKGEKAWGWSFYMLALWDDRFSPTLPSSWLEVREISLSSFANHSRHLNVPELLKYAVFRPILEINPA
jgi:hypothetical protein